MRLITTCFEHTLEARNFDFKYCAIKNIYNNSINEMVIFFENYKDSLISLRQFNHLSRNKIKIINTNSFSDFSVLFDYANKNYKNEIVIIANADIYFDETLAKVDDVKLERDILLFLTRYIFDYGDIRLQNPGSFDSYIFRSPIKSFYHGIKQGIMGCDSYLLQRAIESGIKVFNPALSIKSYHHHFSGIGSGDANKFKYWNQPYYKGCELGYCTIEDVKREMRI